MLKNYYVSVISTFQFLPIKDESIGLVQIFNFRFVMNLHVLGFDEHDLTISAKCLCVRDKNFVVDVAQKVIKNI